jgi:hypothetical protein
LISIRENDLSISKNGSEKENGQEERNQTVPHFKIFQNAKSCHLVKEGAKIFS